MPRLQETVRCPRCGALVEMAFVDGRGRPYIASQHCLCRLTHSEMEGLVVAAKAARSVDIQNGYDGERPGHHVFDDDLPFSPFYDEE